MASYETLSADFDDSLASIRRRLAEQSVTPVSRWVVALSGGVDSVVLLHLLASSKSPEPILIVHVDHQLQDESPGWAKHCEILAQRYALPFRLEKVSISTTDIKRLGLEAAAREARYGALQKHLSVNDVLLTAQHQDDQAETLLLQLMRGAGVEGLAAMPLLKKMDQGWQARPLLERPKAELLRYAEKQVLCWVDDPSNAQDSFDRNFLRQHVLPLLQQRWPAASASISRTASNCADVAKRIAAQQQQDLQSLLNTLHARVVAPEWQQSSYIALEGLTVPLLRHWLKACGVLPPPYERCRELITQLQSASDKQPQLVARRYQLRRFRQFLWLLPAADRQAILPSLRFGSPITLPRLGEISVYFGDSEEAELSWRYRDGGEKIRLAGDAHSSSLKELLRAAKVLPWLRGYLPLLYWRDELVAVCGTPWRSAQADNLGLRLELAKEARVFSP